MQSLGAEDIPMVTDMKKVRFGFLVVNSFAGIIVVIVTAIIVIIVIVILIVIINLCNHCHHQVGLRVAEDQGAEPDNTITGFHWPIHSVSCHHCHRLVIITLFIILITIVVMMICQSNLNFQVGHLHMHIISPQVNTRINLKDLRLVGWLG